MRGRKLRMFMAVSRNDREEAGRGRVLSERKNRARFEWLRHYRKLERWRRDKPAQKASGDEQYDWFKFSETGLALSSCRKTFCHFQSVTGLESLFLVEISTFLIRESLFCPSHVVQSLVVFQCQTCPVFLFRLHFCQIGVTVPKFVKHFL